MRRCDDEAELAGVARRALDVDSERLALAVESYAGGYASPSAADSKDWVPWHVRDAEQMCRSTAKYAHRRELRTRWQNLQPIFHPADAEGKADRVRQRERLLLRTDHTIRENNTPRHYFDGE